MVIEEKTLRFFSALELQQAAEKGKYSVGAFNINNLEILKAIVAASKEQQSPVIVSVTPSAMKYAGVEYLAALVRTGREEAGVPMALHLDHGTSIEHCTEAISAGFSSVMIDGSKQPFEENIDLTRKVVALGRQAGVSIEAELGLVPAGHGQIAAEVPEESMTEPDKAEEFVERTQVDTLAVAFGNAHGWYKGRPKLDFDRLAEIRSRVNIPIVFHGASGIIEEDLKRSIKIGISKVNIDTELRRAFRAGVKDALEENPDADPRAMLNPAIAGMTDVVNEKIRLLGSGGHAG